MITTGLCLTAEKTGAFCLNLEEEGRRRGQGQRRDMTDRQAFWKEQPHSADLRRIGLRNLGRNEPPSVRIRQQCLFSGTWKTYRVLTAFTSCLAHILSFHIYS